MTVLIAVYNVGVGVFVDEGVRRERGTVVREHGEPLAYRIH